MNETFQDITISAPGIIFAFGFEISLPIFLSFLWIKYYKGKISTILFGILGFICSVAIEGITIFLIRKITFENSIILNICSIISTGLFEETGRYIV